MRIKLYWTQAVYYDEKKKKRNGKYDKLKQIFVLGEFQFTTLTVVLVTGH